MTLDELQRQLAINSINIDELAPSYKNLPLHDYTGATSSRFIPSDAGIRSREEYLNKVLLPAINRTFKTNKEFKDYQDDSMSYMMTYPAEYVPQVGPSQSMIDLIKPKIRS